jgi:hypothetical protein
MYWLMGFKTITISDEAHRKLKRHKAKGESFTKRSAVSPTSCNFAKDLSEACLQRSVEERVRSYMNGQ